MPKLIAETDPSLFEPIEVEVEGTTYRARLLDGAAWDKIEEFDNLVKQGSIRALYERLAFVLPDCPLETIRHLMAGEADRITKAVAHASIRPTKTEKNAPAPGDPLPS